MEKLCKTEVTDNQIIKQFENENIFWKYIKVLNYLQSVDIPTNKIIYIDLKNLEIYLEKIEGEPLHLIRNKLSKEELKYIYEQAAEILFRLHTIKAEIKVPFYIYFENLWRKELEKIRNEKAKRFAKQIFETIKWESKELSLVHGDYNDNNWIIKDGKIVGIIDWECAMYFDHFYDLAVFEGWERDKELRKIFIKTYLSLANEDYKIYHEYKIAYQLYYVLQTDPKIFEEKWEDMIWMIEAERNVDFNKIFHDKNR